MHQIKCVVVGDGNVGKTSLLMSYTMNVFPSHYIPTVFDNYSTNLMIANEQIRLQIWDTAGQAEYSRFRPFSYPQTDVFLICFSIGSPTSFDNVQTAWIHELAEHCPTTPLILVGLKSDLRTDSSSSESESGEYFNIVESWEGEQMKEKIKAHKYIECSALSQHNMNKVFEEAVKAVLYPLPPPPLHKARKERCQCCEVA
jgi:Ras-related C3 botulinum toxin substrate 1